MERTASSVPVPSCRQSSSARCETFHLGTDPRQGSGFIAGKVTGLKAAPSLDRVSPRDRPILLEVRKGDRPLEPASRTRYPRACEAPLRDRQIPNEIGRDHRFRRQSKWREPLRRYRYRRIGKISFARCRIMPDGDRPQEATQPAGASTTDIPRLDPKVREGMVALMLTNAERAFEKSVRGSFYPRNIRLISVNRKWSRAAKLFRVNWLRFQGLAQESGSL
jgi:hypothetical protein